MISSILVKNFMRIDKQVEIPVGPVTLLVGQNGSGKSSVLKAIHWALRSASLAENQQGQLKLALERMDFVPSVDFRSLANRSTLQGRAREGASSKQITVSFEDSGGSTSISIKSLGNDAGVNVQLNGALSEVFQKEGLQSAYIPGLAGLSERETILARPVLLRRAASGDGGSVLRQILLLLHSDAMDTGARDQELQELSKWVQKIIPNVRFWVRFDQRRDAFIEAWFFTPDMQYETKGSNTATMRRPLEMAGTGLLQITQIFAYLLYFKPKLLLVDEPDAHLHPTTQEKLIKALEEAANEFKDTQIILTTHSPSLVRASGRETTIVWMDDGGVKDTGDTVRHRMGWGALDKSLILFSEDDNTDMLQSIIDQWPDLSRRTVIWPCFGVSSLPDGSRLSKLRDRYSIKVCVHRDRDFMSDADCNAWKVKQKYIDNNIPVWFPPVSDIEDCFHRPDNVARALDIDPDFASECLDGSLSYVVEAEAQAAFTEAYCKAVQTLAGQTNAIGRWSALGGFCQSTVKGKLFMQPLKKSLQDCLPSKGLATRLGSRMKIYQPVTGGAVCEDLRLLIESVLNPVPGSAICGGS